MLIAYRNKKRKKLLLRVFVNRLMIFIYKIIIVVSENGRNEGLLWNKIHWTDNEYFM